MTDLLDSVGPRDQARLLEQRSGIGSTWMTALPVGGGGDCPLASRVSTWASTVVRRTPNLSRGFGLPGMRGPGRCFWGPSPLLPTEQLRPTTRSSAGRPLYYPGVLRSTSPTRSASPVLRRCTLTSSRPPTLELARWRPSSAGRHRGTRLDGHHFECGSYKRQLAPFPESQGAGEAPEVRYPLHHRGVALHGGRLRHLGRPWPRGGESVEQDAEAGYHVG